MKSIGKSNLYDVSQIVTEDTGNINESFLHDEKTRNTVEEIN